MVSIGKVWKVGKVGTIGTMRIRDILTTSGLTALDAEVLLAHVLGKSRTWLLAHDDEEVSDLDAMRFASLCLRRTSHEPVAYLVGQKEFYGRPFLVTPDVLIPRPATEELVSCALDFLTKPRFIEKEIDTGITALCVPLNEGTPEILIDVGTGSGCIAATLALEGRQEKILAVDTSQAALDIAIHNFTTFKLDIATAVGDGPTFVAAMHMPFVVVSNPPYIREGTVMQTDVGDYEPHEALFAGKDGMRVLSDLARSAAENPACLGICLELETSQAAVTKRLLGVM